VEIDYGTFPNTGRIFAYDRTGGAYQDLGIGNFTGNQGMVVKAGGNVGIGTASPAFPLDVQAAQSIARLVSTGDNVPVVELKNNAASPTLLGAINFNNAVNGFPGQILYSASDIMTFRVAGSTRMTLTAGGLNVNGSTCCTSDRNAKTGFEAVCPQVILDRVVGLPISQWRYTNDLATPHIGPMAQDFYAAFQVGPDDKHIATLDEGGVALAAIKGLNQKLEAESRGLKKSIVKLQRSVEQKETEITELKAEIAEIKGQLAGTLKGVARLSEKSEKTAAANGPINE
jgi:hypothetical protein